MAQKIDFNVLKLSKIVDVVTIREPIFSLFHSISDAVK